MKVLHVTTHDHGGAGIACIRLHQSLIKHKIDSKVLVLNKTNYTVPEIHKFNQPVPPLVKRVRNRTKRILKKLSLLHELEQQEYLKNQPKGFEMFSFATSNFDITTSQLYKECDVVNLHWVAGFLDYTTFFKKNKKKIVWTFHDMNPFTGGCHHADECIKYRADCSNCPQLQGTLDPNYSHKMMALKSEAFKEYPDNQISVVTPSLWLKNLSESSVLFSRFPHYHIPHGLDHSVYKPYDKHTARNFFNLPTDKKVVLFASSFVQNHRKGLPWFLEVFNGLPNKDEFILCTMGGEVGNKVFPFHYPLGYISDERIRALAYAVADVLVFPSFAESFGLVALEALFCGVPVIAFPAGGLSELMVNGQNGILCKEISVNSLKDSFEEFFRGFHSNPENIRANAIARFDEALQASRYEALYNQLNSAH